jgi:DNA-binding winged helix-turn-helix (wHTH) protein
VLDALACSIAQTAADILGQRSDARGGIAVSDEAIGAHLWFERGFRDHDALVQLINHTRRILDERPARPRALSTYRKPVQLSFDLEAA